MKFNNFLTDENDSDAEVRTSTGSKTDELNTEISELQSETEEIPKPPTVITNSLVEIHVWRVMDFLKD